MHAAVAKIEPTETHMSKEEDTGRSKQASKFLARLRNRPEMVTKAIREQLDDVCDYLLSDLGERVQRIFYYTFTPLENATDIRVLKLLSNPGEVLQGRIEHVSLESADFVALSYEWGYSKQVHWIHIIGIDNKEQGIIPLTESLYGALCHLRDCPVIALDTFWIDQVCINQKDLKERGHQVDLMGKIYRTALQVISYLGYGEPSDVEGFKLLEKIDEQYHRLYDQPFLNENLFRFSDRPRLFDYWPDNLKFNYVFPDSAWHSLARLIIGPWTRRLWMLQEVSKSTFPSAWLRYQEESSSNSS
jgi:Heterokaryon incompatibility protein (HET)